MNKISFLFFLACGAWFAGPATAVQIIAENSSAVCEEYRFSKDLRIFKDPAVFLSAVNSVYLDPASTWETLGYENPLLTTVGGTFHMIRLGPPREFKNFASIAKVYDVSRLGITKADRNQFPITADTQIIPVRICGQNEAYADSLGFVIVQELVWAQVDDSEDGQLPPSTVGNPIPKFRSNRDVAIKDSK